MNWAIASCTPARLSYDQVGDGGFVEGDAEAGFFREGDVTVFDLQGFGEEAVAEWALCESARAFREKEIGRGRAKVQAGQEVDGGAGADVGRPRDAEDLGELCDPQGFGDATCAAHVGQEEVAFSVEQPVAHHIAVAIGFANGNANGGRLGQRAIPLMVFGQQGVFKPLDIAQAFEEPGKAQGVFEVESAVRVNEEFAAIPDGVGHLPDEVPLFGERAPATGCFDDREALVQDVFNPFAPRCEGLPGRARGVDGELCAVRAAEQAIDGFAVVFAERVPKGDVDARDGFEGEALRVRAQAHGREHAIPQDGDGAWVFADEERGQEVFDNGFDDPRRDRGVRFANAFDAAVCSHANQGG